MVVNMLIALFLWWQRMRKLFTVNFYYNNNYPELFTAMKSDENLADST